MYHSRDIPDRHQEAALGFDGEGRRPEKTGRWMGGAEAKAHFAQRSVEPPSGYALRCLLRS